MKQSIPVIAIFDVGKTNKKLFLFDEDYNIVFEKSARFEEIIDEDGFPCENLESLRLWVSDSISEIDHRTEFEIKAVNFSTYGASFVYLDEQGQPLAPLYNYLKPFPEALKIKFYQSYGGEEEFSKCTASPVLGSLNSGMQLYRIKYDKPELFNRIRYALHLPQYMSFLISGKFYSDITSIGCHTNLWDFQKHDYHEWVTKEGLREKLPPLAASDQMVPAAYPDISYGTGIGLHDSSAALIPYLVNFQEPFVLISTGTWCISINPFNTAPLSSSELANDCLCYMNYNGKPVKASRLFAGYEHEQQEKRIAENFNRSSYNFRSIEFNQETIFKLTSRNKSQLEITDPAEVLKSSLFAKRDLSGFADADEAYHQLILDLVTQQYVSTGLILKETQVKRIFVDGGFSNNSVYMNLLAAFLPKMEVFAASMAQATAIGTAMAIHHFWNKKTFPTDVIKLKLFSLTSKAMI